MEPLRFGIHSFATLRAGGVDRNAPVPLNGTGGSACRFALPAGVDFNGVGERSAASATTATDHDSAATAHRGGPRRPGNSRVVHDGRLQLSTRSVGRGAPPG